MESAKRFIQNYRKKVLNLEKSYREFYENNYCMTKNQLSLNSLQSNLKDYKMYINNFKQKQLNHRQTSTDKNSSKNETINIDKNKFYIGKLFNLKNKKQTKECDSNNLRSYLNNFITNSKFKNNQTTRTDCNIEHSFETNYSKNNLTNHQMNETSIDTNHITNTFNNQQLIDEIKELRTKQKLNQRIKIENNFRQNYSKNFLQLNDSKNSNNLKYDDDVDKYSLDHSFLNNLLDDSENSQIDAELNELQIRNDSIESETSLLDSEDSEDSLDLSYMDSELYNHDVVKESDICTESCTNSESDEDEEEDQYLDTYTIGSANTEDNPNPISTENFTKLIKKLTETDSMRSRLLELCNQQDALDFEQEFSKENYPIVLNLDSGTFAVTFLALDKANNLIVLKVIRTISKDVQSKLNQLIYSGTETFDEVYSEVMISKALSSLHKGNVNRAHCFPKILNIKLVKGKIPDNFNIIKLKDSKPDQIKGLTIDQFHDLINQNQPDKKTRSATLNDRKKFLKQEPFKFFFEAPVEYTVIAMKYVGKPIWKRLLNQQLNAEQLFGVAQQLIFGLACAERQFNFEHRDLHISNILIKRTKKPEVEFIIDNQIYKLSTNGYRCFIVDMTFSRLTVNNQVFYKDLSSVLYKRQDDENKKLKMQDMVYQMMRDEIGDNWQRFRPRTNLHWLVYVLKTIKTCELFKKNNDAIAYLLSDYHNQASKCYTISELIDYIVNRSS